MCGVIEQSYRVGSYESSDVSNGVNQRQSSCRGRTAPQHPPAQVPGLFDRDGDDVQVRDQASSLIERASRVDIVVRSRPARFDW